MKWTIIEQADGTWAVVDEAGTVIVGGQATREHAVGRLQELAASALGALPAGGIASGRGARFRMRYLEGEQTSDGRVIDPMGTKFDRTPPLPIMLNTMTSEDHKGAHLSGVIDTAYRDSTEVICEGNFDAGSEAGMEHERLVREGILTTWSPDIGDAVTRFEPTGDASEDDDILGLLLGLGEGVLHLVSGTLLGGTGVPFPALASAKIGLDESAPALAASLVAGGFPYVRGTGTIEIIEDPAVTASGEPCVDCEEQREAVVRELDEGAALTFLAFETEALHFGSTGGSVSDAAWDGSASRFTDDQYKFAAAACDGKDSEHPKQDCFMPHHDPGGAINRNGVHAAAQRVSQLSGHPADAVSRAKAHLRSHYTKDLKEDPPSSLGASSETKPFATGGVVRGKLVGDQGPQTVKFALDLDIDEALHQVQPVEAALGRSRLKGTGTIIANEDRDPQEVAARVASALAARERALADFRPPAACFEDPRLSEPTPATTEGDRFFGHLAQWGVCHTGILDRCVLAPHSASNYAYFMQGSVTCEGGERVRCGHLTIGCGHADLALSAEPARAHYDGGPGAVCAAHVATGEDEHGIWFSGVIDPRLDDFQRWELETLAISGDWRVLGGHLELIAALSVPVPGFPILASGAPTEIALPQPELMFNRGELVSVVAAGTVAPRRVAMGLEVARLRQRVERLEALLESRTEPLLASAAERLRDRLRGTR